MHLRRGVCHATTLKILQRNAFQERSKMRLDVFYGLPLLSVQIYL